MPGMIRTRLDNRERRARGHGLFWTDPDAYTGIYGLAGSDALPTRLAGSAGARRAEQVTVEWWRCPITREV
jgi:hypothetical protein